MSLREHDPFDGIPFTKVHVHDPALDREISLKFGSELLQAIRSPRDQDEIGSATSENSRDLLPDTVARARDDRPFVFRQVQPNLLQLAQLLSVIGYH